MSRRMRINASSQESLESNRRRFVKFKVPQKQQLIDQNKKKTGVPKVCQSLNLNNVSFSQLEETQSARFPNRQAGHKEIYKRKISVSR